MLHFSFFSFYALSCGHYHSPVVTWLCNLLFMLPVSEPTNGGKNALTQKQQNTLPSIAILLPESTVGPDTEHIKKLRSSSAAINTAQTPIYGNVNAAAGNGFSYQVNPSQRNNYDQNPPTAPLTSVSNQAKHIDLQPRRAIPNTTMEFLIPQVPNATTAATTATGAAAVATATARQSKTILSNIVGSSITLNDIKSHLNDNFHLVQQTTAAPPKMSKKQLKLAQAQFDKLTQINIHLQGMWQIPNEYILQFYRVRASRGVGRFFVCVVAVVYSMCICTKSTWNGKQRSTNGQTAVKKNYNDMAWTFVWVCVCVRICVFIFTWLHSRVHNPINAKEFIFAMYWFAHQVNRR